jgi:hypothetical protein
MGTLKGFPNLPALWLRLAKPAFAYAIMGTLKGFPNLPALWLQDWQLRQQPPVRGQSPPSPTR